MDSHTARGYTPQYVSKKILSAIVDGKKELTIAPVTARLAVTIRTLSPSLFFWLMERRARNYSD